MIWSTRRSRTAVTSTAYGDPEIICAVCESRGISPTVGLSLISTSTSEAILCQITDTQTYARTCHKIKVFAPTEILYMSTAADSKLVSILLENIVGQDSDVELTALDRRYWAENIGHEHIQHLALPEDLESLKVSLSGNYFALCCFSAAVKYIEFSLSTTFVAQTLRIKYESSEGSMMIDLSTISSLELIQNLQNAKSKHSLYGLLNHTLTPMGARVLRTNVLQPSTDAEKIIKRQDAITELTTREDMFVAVRSALKGFVDADRVLAALVVISTKADFLYMEQSVNNVLMLKTFIDSIAPVHQALVGAASEELGIIRQLCDPENFVEVDDLIKYCLNPDVGYSSKPTELRNQRVYAIRAGVNGFLDVARQTYKEINEDVVTMIDELNDQVEVPLELKYDTARQYFLRIPAVSLEETALPELFINIFRRGKHVECQTLELVKFNQKIKDAHNECISLSDHSVQELILNVRTKIQPLFKISESVAMLDMLSSFAQLVTTSDYVRPELTDTLAIKAGRHPIHEHVHQGDKFVSNDVYATQQNRFQIVTGCNMSGKSTYIRAIALMALMAQVGCFIPAAYASVPLFENLFARVSTDDTNEANISTFSSEMRETAFILHNITPNSLVIIDELGRGTSTTDGLAIAIAVAEALIESKAFVWFVTHFRDLPRILAERAGVVNLHLVVDMAQDLSEMRMRYRVADGYEEEKFYGLALANVVDLPEDIIAVATKVSRALHERNEAKRGNPKAMAVVRKRKLLLNLREQLKQASQSQMETEALRKWLKKLQDEFLIRMKAIVDEGDAYVEDEEGSVTTLMSDIRNMDSSTITGEMMDDDLGSQQSRNHRDGSVSRESSNRIKREMNGGSMRPGTMLPESMLGVTSLGVCSGGTVDNPVHIESDASDDSSITQGFIG
ncbi:hypothetical protein B0A52_07541 [Exophiala mesophila]|uniref:DNA mismatch repair proteins mutS family domain-containing protein n=1 Tax=Exophiala mesophila TaxID=212818 RepID=A0A438MZU0_EXOME|nr:hypothetical protein B0A52_07541 [Exophiala mesophila]